MKNDIKNIDIIAGKYVDEVLNNDQETSPYDKLRSMFKKIKSEHKSTDPSEYYGYILHVQKRSYQDVEAYFGEESKFFGEIAKTNGKGALKLSSVIYECRVHVPEITGILPLPDLMKVLLATKRPDNVDSPTARKDFDENFPRWQAEGFPEVLKMSMFPSFFTAHVNSAPTQYHMCKVKFTDALPTRGYGIMLESLAKSFIPV